MSLPMPDYGLTARLLAQTLAQTRPRPYSMAGFAQVHTHISIRQESLTNVFHFFLFQPCLKLNLCVSSSLICSVKITAWGGSINMHGFRIKWIVQLQIKCLLSFTHFHVVSH